MFTPRKCGVKFDPPTLVVYYEVKLTGMLRYSSENQFLKFTSQPTALGWTTCNSF